MKYCIDKISAYTEKLNLVDCKNWDISQVIEYLKSIDEDVSFSEYAQKYIFEMAKSGMVRNSKNCKLAKEHLERYAGTTNLMFSRFTTQFIRGWIDSLSQTARAKEMYPICVRQIFREAVKDYNDYDLDIIKIKTNPWIKVKIPSSDIPEKKAILPQQVRDFFSAPIPESKLKSPLAELGRDVAMMIICLAGINTVDLFSLEKERCKNGIICYNRAKTTKFRADKAYMEIHIPDIIKPLFEKYKDKTDSKYLLNFYQRYTTTDSFNANVNTGIRRMCESMGMEKEKFYCCYTFRHTWGTIAQNNCGATLEEVGFAMNHASAHKVTSGYIKSDYSRVSILNQKVIDYLFFSAPEEEKAEGSCALMEFRVAPKYQIKGETYFKGRVVAKICDIGFNNKEEVIMKLAEILPDDIPDRSIVQFRLENCDKEQSAIYERQKGKGF